jgi:hypothetical protein
VPGRGSRPLDSRDGSMTPPGRGRPRSGRRWGADPRRWYLLPSDRRQQTSRGYWADKAARGGIAGGCGLVVLDLVLLAFVVAMLVRAAFWFFGRA